MNKNGSMKICYLVNQYPKISHTFIRREILGIEAAGAMVARVSIREVGEPLVDPVDQQEHRKTHFIIAGSSVKAGLRLISSALLCLPSLLRALPVWSRLVSNAKGGLVKHIVYLLEACWFYRFCKQHNIEHVHAHFGTNPAAVAMLSRMLGGAPYSFTVHGPEEFDSPRALSLQEKVHFSKFTVAISSYCKSQLWRWADFADWNKIVEVHCAVDEGILSPPPPAISEKKRFVTIGRLCEQKGQLVLLEAMKELVEEFPDAELHIIGDGEFRQQFEGFIARHKLESNVILHGWRGSQYICEQLDQCRAMVLPSFAEGLPVVIMEAFARRRPVIATYIAAIPELVTPDSGWLAPAGNIPALTAAMREVLLASPADLTEKGEHGYQAVLANHHAGKESSKLYQSIVNF